jgi:hypothetical protein
MVAMGQVDSTGKNADCFGLEAKAYCEYSMVLYDPRPNFCMLLTVVMWLRVLIRL